MSDDQDIRGWIPPGGQDVGAFGGVIADTPASIQPVRPKDYGVEDTVRAALAEHKARAADNEAAESYLNKVRKYGNDDASAFVTANAWVDHVAANPGEAHRLTNEMQRRPRGSASAVDKNRFNWDAEETIENDVRGALMSVQTRERNRQLIEQQRPAIEAIKQKFGGVKPFYEMAHDLEQESQVNPNHAAQRLAAQIAGGQREAVVMQQASAELARNKAAAGSSREVRERAAQIVADPRTRWSLEEMKDPQAMLDTAIKLARRQVAPELSGKDKVAGIDNAVKEAARAHGWMSEAESRIFFKSPQGQQLMQQVADRELADFKREHPSIPARQEQAMMRGLRGGRYANLDEAFRATARHSEYEAEGDDDHVNAARHATQSLR